MKAIDCAETFKIIYFLVYATYKIVQRFPIKSFTLPSIGNIISISENLEYNFELFHQSINLKNWIS